MFRFLVVAFTLSLIANGCGADSLPLPTGPTPEVVHAKAVDKAGTWLVRVSVPESRTTGMKNVPDPTGKTTGVIIPVEESKRADYDLAIDGEQVRACKPDGKPIAPMDLRPRLGKQVKAVMFRGNVNPDAHYLSVLRDDVIVLIVPPEQLVAKQVK